MTEETTQHPEQSRRVLDPLMHTAQRPAQAQMQQAHTAGAVVCPHCGATNAADATFCEQCGALLRMETCPNCGSPIDPEADFCEVCHRYIRPDVCSFCGAHLSQQDAFCPECGSPKGGIVCPTCHTLNDFAFCKQCGMPITEEARLLTAELKTHPEYQQLMQLAREYNELNMQIAYSTDEDKQVLDECMDLRERVLRLLAQDEGDSEPEIPQPKVQRKSKEALDAEKRSKLDKISELLDRLAVPPHHSPAHVRNYAMAQKPVGMRLAWVCNWKHALHSSPCGCAKPQLGGKWVVLGHNNMQEIKDDK